MFELPGFDPKTMTDDQLMNKQLAISQKLNFARRFASFEIIDQLSSFIDAIENERRERMYRLIFEQQKRDIIETEVDLKEKVDEEEPTIAQKRRHGRERIMKSLTPIGNHNE